MGRIAVLPSEMPDDIAPEDGALWDAVAGDLDAIATRVAIRAGGSCLGPTSRALGQHIAGEIAGTAAEIRANIAIVEAAHG